MLHATTATVRVLAGTVAGQIPQLVLFAFAVAVVVFAGQRFGYFGDGIRLAPTSAAALAPGEARSVELFTLLPRDAIRSIDAPRFIAAAEAELPLSTAVIGVQIGTDTRAYPIPTLSNHEIVNDVVGGRAIAVTYCPLCLTGLIFDRTVNGEVLEFGVSGKLLMNVLVMYDRNTDSLWSQILGEGIRGDHFGTQLVVVDSLQTTWGTWRDLHPQTLLLESQIRTDDYRSYYGNDDAGVLGNFNDDDQRLSTKAPVVGVVIGREARAYPFDTGLTQGVINDTLAGVPVLAAFGPDGQTGVLFDRRPDGRTLTFRVDASSGLEMVDTETGSRWHRLTGKALSGPQRGAQLTRVPATTSFWFGWRDFYPHTSVYGLDAGDGRDG